MKSLYLIVFGVVLATATANSVLRTTRQLSISKRYAISPLLEKAELARRAKRQAPTFLGPQDPEQCVLECTEIMDEKLTDAFPEAASNNSNEDVAQKVLKDGDYDAKKFEQFCDIYTPSSRCIRQCPDSDMKKFTVKSLKMVEYMCVERYDDFRKYGKCMDKAGKEIDEICTDQCSSYESGMKKLENLTKENTNIDYDEYDISDLLNQSCLYVGCLIQCDQPIMKQKCGQGAADLELDTIQVAFESLDDIMASTTGDGDLWPDSCEKLAKGETDFNLGTTVGGLVNATVATSPAIVAQPNTGLGNATINAGNATVNKGTVTDQD